MMTHTTLEFYIIYVLYTLRSTYLNGKNAKRRLPPLPYSTIEQFTDLDDDTLPVSWIIFGIRFNSHIHVCLLLSISLSCDVYVRVRTHAIPFIVDDTLRFFNHHISISLR